MSGINESIVEDAALSWFGELGHAVGHGPQLAPGEPGAERDSFGAVVQSRFARTIIPAVSHREKERHTAIRRLDPARSCQSLVASHESVHPKRGGGAKLRA